MQMAERPEPGISASVRGNVDVIVGVDADGGADDGGDAGVEGFGCRGGARP
jgi:hypothetical protein